MEPDDVGDLLGWENNRLNWWVSNTKIPFTKAEITTFVNQEQNIYLNQQLRLMICLNATKKAIGCVDLFEFDEQQKIAGVGILIAEINQRNKGYGKEALNLVAVFAKNELKLHQLFCNIHPENTVSIALFEGVGYSFTEKQVVFGQEVNHYQLLL